MAAQLGHPLLQAQAVDQDAGVHNHLDLNLQAVTDSDIHGHFLKNKNLTVLKYT